MSKNHTKVFKMLLINIAISIAIVISFFITAFLLGYGSNSIYANATIRLYIAFVILHFAINLLVLFKFKLLTIKWIVITFLQLFIIYSVIAQYFNG